MRRTLFVIAHASDWDAKIWRDVPGTSSVTLCFDGVVNEESLPAGSSICMLDDLMDAELIRRAYLDFLETWPQRASASQESLDELLTIDGRYSLWWTSVAAHRQPDHGSYRYFRVAALVDRAMERYRPTTIHLLTHDPMVTWLVQSRAQGTGIRIVRAPGCAEPVTPNTNTSVRWWIGSSLRGVSFWFANLLPTLRRRLALRRAQWKPSSRPAIVFASRFELYLALRKGTLALLNWREISDAIAARDASIEQVFLPRALDRVVDDEGAVGGTRRGIEALRHSRAPLLLHECYVPVRGQLAGLRRQLVASWRFFRIVRSRRFSAAFRFAGIDMMPVLVPQLRNSVTQIVDWSFKTGQLRCALRAAGNVRVVIVTEEMYPWSMPVLAAAAALGIPTVGVQHGNMMPAHLTYRVPQGHIKYAPIPDYLAVYGSFAKEIVAGLGAYPSTGVWITGAARFDALVNRPMPKHEARSRLGLPSSKRVVVLATQTFSWFPSAIRAVLECVRHRPDVVLCIKKHQSLQAMSADNLRMLAAEVGGGDVRVFEGDLDLLLAASDVWISASSTTILESALIGTRSICLNFSGEPDRYPYVEDGASLPARSVEELRWSLARALDADADAGSEARRLAFLARHAGPTKDGRASQTLADRLIELCRRSSRPRLPLTAA